MVDAKFGWHPISPNVISNVSVLMCCPISDCSQSHSVGERQSRDPPPIPTYTTLGRGRSNGWGVTSLRAPPRTQVETLNKVQAQLTQWTPEEQVSITKAISHSKCIPSTCEPRRSLRQLWPSAWKKHFVSLPRKRQPASLESFFVVLTTSKCLLYPN